MSYLFPKLNANFPLLFVLFLAIFSSNASSFSPEKKVTSSENSTQDSSFPSAKNQTAVQQLLSQLPIKQGKGEFTQKKYFKFLSQPINSSGQFIVEDNSALWQTDTPVFTQLLVKPEAVYQRQSKQNKYQPLVKDSQLSHLLATIFKAQIASKDWQIIESKALDSSNQPRAENCITLKPKDSQIAQVFKLVELCLLDKKQRQVQLIDNHNNKTEILMQLKTSELTPADLNNLAL